MEGGQGQKRKNQKQKIIRKKKKKQTKNVQKIIKISRANSKGVFTRNVILKSSAVEYSYSSNFMMTEAIIRDSAVGLLRKLK